jgi:site-specific recombinase XerD
MEDYEQYEKDCELIREQNKKLLDGFRASLQQSGLAEKTIKNHLQNIDFYINTYLLNYEIKEAKDGVDEISMFLGYWFIKKAMWASQATIRSNAASFKKFYAFMLDEKLISNEDLLDLKTTIKEEMPEWLEEIKSYDDVDSMW